MAKFVICRKCGEILGKHDNKYFYYECKNCTIKIPLTNIHYYNCNCGFSDFRVELELNQESLVLFNQYKEKLVQEDIVEVNKTKLVIRDENG